MLGIFLRACRLLAVSTRIVTYQLRRTVFLAPFIRPSRVPLHTAQGLACCSQWPTHCCPRVLELVESSLVSVPSHTRLVALAPRRARHCGNGSQSPIRRIRCWDVGVLHAETSEAPPHGASRSCSLTYVHVSNKCHWPHSTKTG